MMILAKQGDAVRMTALVKGAELRYDKLNGIPFASTIRKGPRP